ncbi:MAG: GNAT family N-acetyltransferase [Ignavibacteriales bacterium]
MNIHINDKKDIDKCLDIMKSLPEFFNQHGLELFQEDVLVDELITIEEDGILYGFVTLKDKFENASEISWMAVKKELQRKGIGSRLILESIKNAQQSGKKILMVKTLAETIEYEPYNKTRAFYEKNGFLPLEIIKDYPEWGPEHDCKIYIKII